MKTVSIWKASQLTERDEVPSVEIRITTTVPEEVHDLEEAYAIYQNDAKLIANALFGSLPQGTMDRLIAELMGRKASQIGYKGTSKP